MARMNSYAKAARIEAERRAEIARTYAAMTPAEIAIELLETQTELALMDHQRRVSPHDAGMRAWHETQYASLTRRIEIARAEYAARNAAAQAA